MNEYYPFIKKLPLIYLQNNIHAWITCLSMNRLKERVKKKKIVNSVNELQISTDILCRSVYFLHKLYVIFIKKKNSIKIKY